MSAARWLGLALAALAVVTLDARTPARACCPVFAPEPGRPAVQIGEQEVLIAWDPATKVEHFVRSASFGSRAPGFGFLVPSPAPPELAEADGEVFDRLREEIQPRVVTVTDYEAQPQLLCACLAPPAASLPATGSAAPPGEEVRVLRTQRVAGYDATVLQADDAEALGRWLAMNGYDARPAMREWLEPYLAARWTVTAFRYAAEQGQVVAKCVRMSFPTDAPVFPYRVPRDQLVPADQGALLRLYYVGPGRGSGGLGPTSARTRPWSAKVAYATSAPSTPLATLLAGAVPAGPALAGAWLTSFEDRTWPGGVEDLWLSAASDGEALIPTVERRVTRVIPIPIEVVALALFGVFYVVRRRGRTASE